MSSFWGISGMHHFRQIEPPGGLGCVLAATGLVLEAGEGSWQLGKGPGSWGSILAADGRSDD